MVASDSKYMYHCCGMNWAQILNTLRLLLSFTNLTALLNLKLLMTNLPKYFDGCYTEEDLVDLLRSSGVEDNHDIYVIPQKQMVKASALKSPFCQLSFSFTS